MTSNPFRFFASCYWRKAHGMEIPSLLDQALERIPEITGVLHVGAHVGQEAEIYSRRGIERVTWIEANPALETRLRERVQPLGHRVIMQAVGSHAGLGTLHLTSNDAESSSLFPLGLHKDIWPDVTQKGAIGVAVQSLDFLHGKHDFTKHNLWVLDVQGAEADVLRGATSCLAIADYVFCEVAGHPLYEGGCSLDDIDRLLPDFTAIACKAAADDIGDILYKRVRRTGRELLRTT